MRDEGRYRATSGHELLHDLLERLADLLDERTTPGRLDPATHSLVVYVAHQLSLVADMVPGAEHTLGGFLPAVRGRARITI